MDSQSNTNGSARYALALEPGGAGIEPKKTTGATRRRRATWGVTALVLILSTTSVLPSCIASKNRDGSWSLEFAPDMVITATGLENMAKQLKELWQSCLAGEWDRPCTESEIQDVKDSLDKTIALKRKLAQSQEPPPSLSKGG